MKNRLKNLWKQMPVCIVTIILCTAIWALINLEVFVPSTSGTAVLLGCFYRPFLLAGEFWRLLTCGLIHVSFWHLLLNMYALYNLSGLLERRYGTKRYVILLAGSTIGGSLFLSAGSTTVMAVGISGGLYGLMAALIILFYRAGLLADPRIRSSLMRTIFMNLMINLMPGVGVLAHLGGFVTGALIALAFENVQDKGLQRNCALSAVLLCIVLAGFTWLKPRMSEDRYIGFDESLLYYEGTHGVPKSYVCFVADRLDGLYDTDYIGDDLRFYLGE